MTHAGRIVALGLTLVVGALGGFLVGRTMTPTVANAGTASPLTATVTATAQAEPVTVTVEPQPNDDPTGPKANGNYLVGAQLAPGTWQCSEAGSLTSWFARDEAGGVTPNWGSGTLAVIPDSAYIADLLDCAGSWSIVTG